MNSNELSNTVKMVLAVAENANRNVVTSQFAKSDDTHQAKPSLQLAEIESEIDALEELMFAKMEAAWAIRDATRGFSEHPSTKPIVNRKRNFATEAKVREAHRLLIDGQPWKTVKKTCSYDTYIRHCLDVTGQEPITK